MDVHLIIVSFFATFFGIHGLPISNSVYDEIQRSASDVNLKCPYVRTTKLLEPEPKFLANCDFSEVTSLTNLAGNADKGLCLLYYDTFEHLCYVSNNYTENIKMLLSNDQIELIPVTYQSNVTQVCSVLKNIQATMKESTSGIELLRTHLVNDRKCERLCTDLDINVKPICSLSAFMMNTTIKLIQEIQNQNAMDLKNEKGKSKPSVIDHNADNQGISKNLGDGNKKESVAEVVNPVIPPEKILPLVKPNSEVANPSPQSMQKVTSKNGETPEKKGAAIEHHNSNGDQSPAVPTLKTPSNSNDGLKKQTEQQSGMEEEEVAPFPPSDAMPQDDGKSIKVEPQINAPSVPEKLEELQVSSSPSTISGNNNAAQIPGEPVQKETNANKPESPIETKPDTKVNPKKIEENAKTIPVVHKEPPKMEDTYQDIRVQEGNAKLSTNGDEVEAAEEAPQDAKNEFLNEPDDDGGLDNDFIPNAADYTVDEQPKTDAVKASPEKSKPREIDEDGPSFAASNYQNQSIDDSDSYFFSYFMMVCIMFICGYVAYHNKQKILALVVEGRKGRRTSRTRRPNSANYRKLDSNLEEAVTSSCNKNATQVIY